MTRHSLVVMTAVVLLGLALYVALPARDRSQPVREATAAREWINPVYLTEPAAGVRRAGLQAPLTDRIIDRIGWATTEVQNYSLRQLLARADAADRVAAKIEELLPTRSLEIFYLARLLEFLGQTHEEAHIEVILRCLEHPSKAVPLAAVKALGAMDTARARARLVELTRSSDPALRDAALATFGKDTLAPQAQLELLLSRPARGVEGIMESLAIQGFTPAIAAIATYLDDARPAVALAAAKALAMLHDPNGQGVAKLLALLRSTRVEEQLAALRCLTVARVLPSPEECERLLSSTAEEVRALGAEMVAAARPELEAERRLKSNLLDRAAEDSTKRVRMIAVQGLYEMGRTDVALPLIDDVRARRGGELMEAVQVLSEQLKDPRGLGALRERIARPAEPYDRAALLHGLAQYGDTQSVGLFVADLERAGRADDPALAENGKGLKLSEHAAVKVQAFGRSAAEALLALIVKRPPAPVARLALDALRGALRRPGAADDHAFARAAAEQIATLIRDERLDPSVRLAAVDTFPYFDDASLVDLLAEASAHVRNPDVYKRAQLVLWNYF